jgi:hypothetical protein
MAKETSTEGLAQQLKGKAEYEKEISTISTLIEPMRVLERHFGTEETDDFL